MIDIDAHIKTAMKARDAVALTAYRSLKQKATLKLTEAGRPGDKALTEEEFVALTKREIKERSEANSFLKPGNPTYEENARIVSILETHLPKALGAEQLEAAIRQAIAATGAAGPKDFGKVMGALKKAGPGIDMAAASARVKALLEKQGA
jgi:uncharacterized protein